MHIIKKKTTKYRKKAKRKNEEVNICMCLFLSLSFSRFVIVLFAETFSHTLYHRRAFPCTTINYPSKPISMEIWNARKSNITIFIYANFSIYLFTLMRIRSHFMHKLYCIAKGLHFGCVIRARSKRRRSKRKQKTIIKHTKKKNMHKIACAICKWADFYCVKVPYGRSRRSAYDCAKRRGAQ